MPAVVLWDSIKIYLVADMYIKISFLWGKEYTDFAGYTRIQINGAHQQVTNLEMEKVFLISIISALKNGLIEKNGCLKGMMGQI